MISLNNYFNFFIYFLSIIFSSLILCWIIWARFLRTRIIKDIPITLNEYGFWTLFYVCIVYLFISTIILISLFKQKKNKTNERNAIKELINQIYTPFVTLDHTIKYNQYVINSYYNSMTLIIRKLKKFTEKDFTFLILIFQIIPRIILVGFLIMDTFYFHKLEILYKIILIGLLPFLFRYIKYNFNDFKEYYSKHLEEKYKFVLMFEKRDNNSDDDEDKLWDLYHNHEFHNKFVPIKKYLELKIKQCLHNEEQTIFEEDPYAQDHIYEEYKKANNIPENVELSEKDLEKVHEDFKANTNIICDSAAIYEKISYFQNKKIILYLRVFIYLSYLICWSFILVTSYYHYPINLPMFKIFIENLIIYLQIYDIDPFSMFYQHSVNENLITKKTISNLIKKLY